MGRTGDRRDESNAHPSGELPACITWLLRCSGQAEPISPRPMEKRRDSRHLSPTGRRPTPVAACVEVADRKAAPSPQSRGASSIGTGTPMSLDRSCMFRSVDSLASHTSAESSTARSGSPGTIGARLDLRVALSWTEEQRD